jgi:hypothetical protein
LIDLEKEPYMRNKNKKKKLRKHLLSGAEGGGLERSQMPLSPLIGSFQRTVLFD